MMSGTRHPKHALLAMLPAALLLAPAHAETRYFTDFGLDLCEATNAGEPPRCKELSDAVEIKFTGSTRKDAKGRTLYEAATRDGSAKAGSPRRRSALCWSTTARRRSRARKRPRSA